MNAIADVQSSRDLRNLPINQVGIKDLRFPISLKSKEGEQSTVARLTMTVFLPADQKRHAYVALCRPDGKTNRCFGF